MSLRIGNKTIKIGYGGFSWSQYWASRTPTDIVLTPISDTEIQVDWTDAAEGADGIRIYVDGVLDGTADFGDETYTVDGLTADTEYEITVVAYDGSHESPEISDDATTFTSQFSAVYASWTNKPDAADAAKYNTWVKSKIADGTWVTRDVLYNFAVHTNDDGEALKNWINPGTHDATLVNVPAFVAYEGFTPNGTSSYIRTNYVPSVDGVNYTLNDCSLFLLTRTDNDDFIWGEGVFDGTNWLSFIYGAGSYYVRLNDSVALSAVGADDDKAYRIIQRTAANARAFYKNNALINSDAQASAALITKEIYLGVYNNNGAPNFTYGSKAQHSICEIGASLDATERTAIQADAEAYMDSNGKGIL